MFFSFHPSVLEPQNWRSYFVVSFCFLTRAFFLVCFSLFLSHSKEKVRGCELWPLAAAKSSTRREGRTLFPPALHWLFFFFFFVAVSPSWKTRFSKKTQHERPCSFHAVPGRLLGVPRE